MSGYAGRQRQTRGTAQGSVSFVGWSVVFPSRFLLAGVLSGAVVTLAAAQPPIESALGHEPVPAVVAMQGPVGLTEDPDFYRWAVTQGGLTVVCLVLIAMLAREAKATAADKAVLVGLVEKNAAAATAAAEASHRLARAIEARGTTKR
jgi:hypothetical protein